MDVYVRRASLRLHRAHIMKGKMMELADELNRTVKLALDEGRAGSLVEAQALFEGFKLRIAVGDGFTSSLAAEAAVLTLLTAATKTFLGGVELVGAVDERCTLAWFEGRKLSEVAIEAGAVVGMRGDAQGAQLANIVVGSGRPAGEGFSVALSLDADGFVVCPDSPAHSAPQAPVEVGVAAAGAALNEAFAHQYRRFPVAGQRRLTFRMPATAAVGAVSGTTWMVGLGHLGQAFAWTLALSPGSAGHAVRLTDFDLVTGSSLSTCLLVKDSDIARLKVHVVGERLTSLGLTVSMDAQRLNLDGNAPLKVADRVIVAVDNVALRRSLDRLAGIPVFEGGIGGGKNGFTRVQFHMFPGSRPARDVWADADPRASQAIDISAPAYQAMLKQTGDECGTTLLAGRSIATPFVGAFAGAVLYGLALGGPIQPNSGWAFDLNHL